MFFRNLTLFRLTVDAALSLTELDAALDQKPLRHCGPLEASTQGFVSPYGAEGALCCRAGNAALFTLGREEKVLPAAVVNAEVAKRVRAIESETGTPVGRKARKRIKEEVLDTLLARAFVRPSRTSAYYDAKQGWLCIDTASRKAGEQVLSALREALGSLPALPLAPEDPPRAHLTGWLSGATHLPSGLELGDECELRDPADRSIAKFRQQDLERKEILAHLKAGKQVYQLGLVYDERISFTLREDLTLTKVRLLDGALESLDGQESDSMEAEIDARFALMSGEFANLLKAMEGWFGLERPE